MYPSNFWKNFRLLVCAPANQQTKWRQMTADLTDNSRCIDDFQCENLKCNKNF